jgi:hypothetical protein
MLLTALPWTIILPSYISWKEDNSNYLIQRVGAFLLSSPDHFREYRKQVRNILDWGKDKRPKQIGDALDIILERTGKGSRAWEGSAASLGD